MRPRNHLILGAGASAAVYHTFGLNTVFFWVASFMIDIDHYMNFIYHNGFRSMSFTGMFTYYGVVDRLANLPEFLDVEVFHSAEFMLTFYLISRLLDSYVLMAVWNGIFFKRTNFIIEYFIRKKGLMSSGLNPDDVYNEALRNAGIEVPGD